MSATDVIQQIKSLPAAEQEKVFAFVDSTRHVEPGAAPGVQHIPREEARAIRQRIFQTNAELLRKLAQ